MNRKLGLLAVSPLAAGLLFLGAGAASADGGNGTVGDNGASASTTTSNTTNSGSGNVLGGVDGNYNATQQSATGSGASNQNNNAGVKGNSGVVVIDQGNANVQDQHTAIHAWFPWF
ncbi:hypothetical protein [Streptomyces sp. SID3343]|uniref:hypothetical protein n=1 Tax=Streptomyces sp. SID3343 TaxID=2690260 RepID=UPI0013692F1A|nr:hypothetical protein [Streptomyces sp. SID3343]MYV99514.1 hypothetical protein [Streptomyces sp. SID3343]